MKAIKFFNVLLSFILLLAFIGIPVSQGLCNMDFCQKESAMNCCSEAASTSCQQSTEYIQLDSDFSYTDASVKIPDLAVGYLASLNYLENSVTGLIARHGEIVYTNPSITIDIPVRVRCFRI